VAGNEGHHVRAGGRDEGLEGEAQSVYKGERALSGAFWGGQLVERDHVSVLLWIKTRKFLV